VALIPLFKAGRAKAAIVGLVAAVLLAAVMTPQVPAVPGELIAYGRQMQRITINQPSFTRLKDATLP